MTQEHSDDTYINTISSWIEPWFVKGAIKDDNFTELEEDHQGKRIRNYFDTLEYYKYYNAHKPVVQCFLAMKRRGGAFYSELANATNRFKEKYQNDKSVLAWQAMTEIVHGSSSLKKEEYEALIELTEQNKMFIEEPYKEYTRYPNEYNAYVDIIERFSHFKEIPFEKFQQLNREAIKKLKRDGKITVDETKFEQKIANWGEGGRQQQKPAPEQPLVRKKNRPPLKPESTEREPEEEPRQPSPEPPPPSAPEPPSSSPPPAEGGTDPEEPDKPKGVSKKTKYGAMAAGGAMVVGGLANAYLEEKKQKQEQAQGKEKPKKGLSFATVSLCLLGAAVTAWALWLKAAPANSQEKQI